MTINGRRHYLWRAVDQDGNVLDILVSCRESMAAKRLFRKLLKRQCTSPRVLVTDQLPQLPSGASGGDGVGRAPAVEVPTSRPGNANAP